MFDADDLFEHRERKMQAWLDKRPVCDMCHEPIQDESAHKVPNAGVICDKCLAECEFLIDD